MLVFLFQKLILSNRAGNLVRRISRLSMIGIGVSTFAFFIVLFVMSGMNQTIEKRIVSLEPHLTLIKTSNKNISFLEKHLVLEKLNDKNIKSFSIFESQDVILRSMDGQFRGAIAQGFSRKSLETFNQNLVELENHKVKRTDKSVNTTHLDNLDKNDQWSLVEAPGMNEVYLGIDLARSMGVFEGDFIMVSPPESLLLAPGEVPVFEKVRVKKTISTNLADIDSQYLFYLRDLSLNSLKTSLSRQVGIEVWFQNPLKTDRFKEELKEFLSAEKDWIVETWMDRNSALFYSLKLEKIMIGIFLGLAGIISSFSIITVLALLISEKTRDIAMLRTLGLSQKKTIQIFIKMGMVISSIGLFAGTFFGLSLGLYIEKYPLNILPDIYYDSTIPARVEFGLVATVVAISILISFLGAYIPTRALEQITPSQALRQKN